MTYVITFLAGAVCGLLAYVYRAKIAAAAKAKVEKLENAEKSSPTEDKAE